MKPGFPGQSLLSGSVAFVLVVLAACSVQKTAQNQERDEAQAAGASNVARPLPEPRVEELAATQAPAPAPAERRAGGRVAQKLMAAPSAAIADFYYQPPPEDRENYGHFDSNPLQRVAEHPVSTFSIDVDTGSYANVRRFLREGRLPPADAVRVEELINYFDYAYAVPRDPSTPFALSTEIAPTPWNSKTHLLRVGIQGWKPQGPRPQSNLVFLVDVSGSMDEPNKLPLVKSSLKLLARQLGKDDRISMVVYAGASGVVLEPTAGDKTTQIEAALDRLQAGGSTNGASGIQLAYAMAKQAFVKNGNNRVLLATDGDFNVGITSFEALLDLVRNERKSGIALTTLGFGTGNYNDHLMEQLADAGQGNYAYIDTLTEAQKVLVDQRDATLRTIAADVKIQIEFNPAAVAEYRLIGYENRMLKREDFNNDQIDAGEIGAGHRVTALYEIALAGSGGERVEPLRYGKGEQRHASVDELAFLRLRYKKPEDGVNAASKLIEQVLRRQDIKSEIARTSENFRLAAAVAGFGQVLRGGTYTNGFGYAQAQTLARGARGTDEGGYAGELLQLIALADSLSSKQVRAEE
jgi:Ca-activated chloride channel family protein